LIDSDIILDIFNKYGLKLIGIFGSYVKGNQSPESDLDIVFNDTLKPYIGKAIRKEVIIV